MKEKGLIMKQSQEKVELAMLRGETVLPSWLEMEGWVMDIDKNCCV